MTNPSVTSITLTLQDLGGGVLGSKTPPIGFTEFANKPSGMTDLEVRDFDTVIETGWWDPGSSVTILADSSSNFGGANVGRMTYLAGHAGGTSPTSTGTDLTNSAIWNTFGASREVYISYERRHSANWEYHSSGTNKELFCTIDSGGNPMLTSTQSNLEGGTAPPQLIVVSQGTGGVSVPENTPIAEVAEVLGEWDYIEIHLIANTTNVNEDGEFHTWVNGTKVQEDFACSWKNVNGPLWDTLKWDPTWGGGGGTTANEMYMDISKINVSVK